MYRDSFSKLIRCHKRLTCSICQLCEEHCTGHVNMRAGVLLARFERLEGTEESASYRDPCQLLYTHGKDVRGEPKQFPLGRTDLPRP